MIHLQWFGYWFLFTFAFVLCNYPIVLRACRMLLCCTLLLFTLYRCQIKDCRYTDTPCPFYPRTGHVSSPKCLTQQAYVITPYPLSIAQYLLLMYVDLSDLQIWNWIVQIACMYILTAHNHQTAGLTVGNFLPAFFDFAYITLLAFATCDKLQLATCFIPPHYSYLGIRIVLIHLVYFI